MSLHLGKASKDPLSVVEKTSTAASAPGSRYETWMHQGGLKHTEAELLLVLAIVHCHERRSTFVVRACDRVEAILSSCVPQHEFYILRADALHLFHEVHAHCLLVVIAICRPAYDRLSQMSDH